MQNKCVQSGLFCKSLVMNPNDKFKACAKSLDTEFFVLGCAKYISTFYKARLHLHRWFSKDYGFLLWLK